MQARYECELPPEVKKRYEKPMRRAEPNRAGVIFLLGVLAFGAAMKWPPSSQILAKAKISEAKESPARVLGDGKPRAQTEPVVRRAELVELVAPRAGMVIGSAYPVPLPDGRTVWAVFRGFLNSVDLLPRSGGSEGDMYQIGSTCWVLTTIGGRLGWMDP